MGYVSDGTGYTLGDEALQTADSPGDLALIQAVVPRMDVLALLASLPHAASSANAARAD